MRRYSLNDIGYNTEPVTLLRRGEEVDPDYDEEAAMERTRATRMRDEELLRDFEERVRTGNMISA